MNNINAFSNYGIAMPKNSSRYNSYNNFQNGQYNKGQNGYSDAISVDQYARKTKDENASSSKYNKSSQTLEVTSYTDKEGRVHKTYTGKSTDVVESMKKANESKKNEKAKSKKRLNYSFQKVSSQVIMAKNSVSASKAVLSARRSLSDLKRKLKTVECSDDEKMAALTHATRMLRIAKKKKNNLEMEELIKATMDSDERNEKFNELAEVISDLFDDDKKDKKNENENILEKINSASENEDEKTEEMATDDYEIEELSEDLEDDLDEESLKKLSEEFEKLEEEMSEEMLEEVKNLMSMMEAFDPHMSEEQFEKLKTKHRCQEQKEIVKADMDYLKEYIRIIQEEQGKGVNSDNTGYSPDAYIENVSFASVAEMPFVDFTVNETSLGFIFGA